MSKNSLKVANSLKKTTSSSSLPLGPNDPRSRGALPPESPDDLLQKPPITSPDSMNKATALGPILLEAAKNSQWELIKNKFEDTTLSLYCKKQLAAAQNEDGFTLLYFATKAGKQNICSTLMDLGANAEKCGVLSQSPFFKAISCNHPGIVELMINKGVNPNTQFYKTLLMKKEERGYTPLELAVKLNDKNQAPQAKSSHFDVIHTLLSHNAIITPEVLKEKGFELYLNELANILKEAPKFPLPAFKVVDSNDTKTLKEMLEKYSINAKVEALDPKELFIALPPSRSSINSSSHISSSPPPTVLDSGKTPPPFSLSSSPSLSSSEVLPSSPSLPKMTFTARFFLAPTTTTYVGKC